MLVKSRIRVQQEELVARQQPVRLPPIENPPMPPEGAPPEEALPEPAAEAESAAEPAAEPDSEPAAEPESEPELLPEPLPELESDLVLDPEPQRQPALAREQPVQTGCGCFRRPPPQPRRLAPPPREPSQLPTEFLTVVAPAGLVPGQKVSSPCPLPITLRSRFRCEPLTRALPAACC